MMHISGKMIAGAVSAIALAAGTASAQMSDSQMATATEGDSVTLTGIVNSVETDSFTIDYGMNMVEVEFDDLFSDVEADEQLSSGDRVTVFGTVDDDWFEGRVVDAEQVYVRDSYTVYGESTNNSILGYIDPYPSTMSDETYLSLDGEVTNTRNQTFVLNTGGTSVDVETDQLGYNPLDDMGAQQIEVGDRVTVVGTLEDQLFSDSVLVADIVYSQNTPMMETSSNSQSNQRYGDAGSQMQNDMTASQRNSGQQRMAENAQENEANWNPGNVDTENLGDEGSMDVAQADDPDMSDNEMDTGMDSQQVAQNEQSGQSNWDDDRNEDMSQSGTMSTTSAGGQAEMQTAQNTQNTQDTQGQQEYQSTQTAQDNNFEGAEEMFTQTEFAALDENDNGTVSQSEFVSRISDPANITRSEARRMFQVVARNDDTLTRSEFVTPYDEAENVSEEIVDRES